MSKSQVIVISWIGLCAVAIVSLCWLGIARDYNPTPYWDSWDGLVKFVLRFPDSTGSERLALLFEQHNEHRFLLTRGLFLLDYAVFNSSFVLLYVFNGLIPLLAVWVVARTASGQGRFEQAAILAVSCCFLFLLVQRENFGWEFQSQFFLAFYVPLLGYFLVVRFWSDSTLRNGGIIGLTALVSAFTMANGALYAAPLVFLFIWKSETRAASLMAAAVLVLVLLLYLVVLPYESTPEHGNVARDVLPNIGAYVIYVLTYIGSPFGGNTEIKPVFGLLFVLLSLRFFWKSLTRDSMKDRRNVLLLYIIFYAMTVAVTGIGRVNFGVEQALADRYLTPTLLAWLCLLVLGLLHLRSAKWHRAMYFGVLPFLALVGLAAQIGEYEDTGNRDFERSLARLALHMSVLDEPAIEQVYPRAAVPTDLYAKSAKAGLTFARPMDAWTTLGDGAVAQGSCQGTVEDVNALPGGYSRVTGWIVNPATADQADTPVAVALGKIVGLGHRGSRVADAVSTDMNAGFVVYLPTSDVANGTVIHSGHDHRACVLPI